jgi:hypothetical protein
MRAFEIFCNVPIRLADGIGVVYRGIKFLSGLKRGNSASFNNRAVW